MAGVGFELDKVIKKKGLLSLIQGYSYSGMVILGPILLGILLLLFIRIMGSMAGASGEELDMLVSLVTIALLFSLTINSFFSMTVCRYAANKIYEKEKEKIVPSFIGNISIMLIIGGIIYGLFLVASKISIINKVFCLILFMELVVVWASITYLTAVKDFIGIVKRFLAAMIIALLSGYVLLKLSIPITIALLGSIIIGYGIMMVGYIVSLVDHFPGYKGSSFTFMKLFDTYPALWLTGVLMNIGMYAHIVIIWNSPLKMKIQGGMYSAPLYDVPAFYAFLSILITSVNFIVSLETNFYPKYKKYFKLLNGKGTMSEINQTEEEMLTVLMDELNYMAKKQLFTTLIFIVIVGRIFMSLGIGFTSDMYASYWILCVGYASYAIGNTFQSAVLYFAGYWFSLISSAVFAVMSILGTLFALYMKSGFYGIGFTLGAMCFYLISWGGFKHYTDNLKYYLLCRQSVRPIKYKGIFTKISIKLGRWEQKFADYAAKGWTGKVLSTEETVDENSEIL